MMRKYLFIALLVLAAVVVVSCAPEGPVDLNSLSDEEMDAAMEAPEESGALAGKATNTPAARARPAARRAGCSVSGSNLVLTDKSGSSRTIPRRYCQSDTPAERICQESGGYTSRSGEQCLAGYECSRGDCIAVCGNGLANAGETCSSCPADVTCAAESVCRDGVCCQPRRSTSYCEGNTAVNTTETDCISALDIYRQDCAVDFQGRPRNFICYGEEGLDAACRQCGRPICELNGDKIVTRSNTETCGETSWPRNLWQETGRSVTGPSCP